MKTALLTVTTILAAVAAVSVAAVVVATNVAIAKGIAEACLPDEKGKGARA